MIWKCIYCGKEREDLPCIAKKRKYCSSKCQMHYEYENGIRDKFKIVEKAQKASHKKMKENNWLNTKESRDKLRAAMKTERYRKQLSDMRRGENNPMYGKKPWNYIDGGYRSKSNNGAFRGFDWKKIRKQIKIRDNYTCQECGITEEEHIIKTGQYLQIHHIVPYRIFEDNSQDNLITLCAKCHGGMEYQMLKVKSIKKIEKLEKVFNLSVDEDESYVANDIIVHNCRSKITAVLE